MAALGIRNRRQLADLAGLPYDGIRNSLNLGNKPDPISLARAYQIARVLAGPDETVQAVLADILVDGGDGTPSLPPNQPTAPPAPRKPAAPKGPKRVTSAA